MLASKLAAVYQVVMAGAEEPGESAQGPAQDRPGTRMAGGYYEADRAHGSFEGVKTVHGRGQAGERA